MEDDSSAIHATEPSSCFDPIPRIRVPHVMSSSILAFSSLSSSLRSSCRPTGATVFVTSGSADKIESAKKLGAAGGVSYKEGGSQSFSSSRISALSPSPDSCLLRAR